MTVNYRKQIKYVNVDCLLTTRQQCLLSYVRFMGAFSQVPYCLEGVFPTHNGFYLSSAKFFNITSYGGVYICTFHGKYTLFHRGNTTMLCPENISHVCLILQPTIFGTIAKEKEKSAQEDSRVVSNFLYFRSSVVFFKYV